jgi:Tol biopolymer transport system component
VASDGTQANDHSFEPSLSADGRYIAFQSAATNLVSGDTNSNPDIFIHDRQTGKTIRASIASDGAEGNDGSYYPSLSADGRYVAFDSFASNLVSDDTNGMRDVFVYDRQTGQTSRVSVASDGTQGNGMSDQPSLSADGRYVAFSSIATNLIDNDTNQIWDIFIHDRQTKQTNRVSVASDGTEAINWSEAPFVSADGRYIAFQSYASNLVSGDTNSNCDVFLHDRQNGQTSRVSVASNGTEGNHLSGHPSLSADGRYISFESYASNLVSGDTNGNWDVFLHDQQTGQTIRVSVSSDESQANYHAYEPSLSADGNYVAFHSAATNLVSNDTNGSRDVFVHEHQTGHTSLGSITSHGFQANNASQRASISGDGRYVAFESMASNLVGGDTNGVLDIFIHDGGASP